jgi:putative alpha-1,2-mannosidase
MGSFVAMSMMGLIPVPGQNIYLITPPYFPSISLTSPLTKKAATIRVTNFDPTYEAVFIQRAWLNGVEWTRSWVDHSFFTEGMELVLEVGRNESAWGTGEADLPPSLSTSLGG